MQSGELQRRAAGNGNLLARLREKGRGEARCCPGPGPNCQCILSYAVLRAVLRCLMLADVLFVVSYAVLCCPVLSYGAVMCCLVCTLVVCPSCPAPPLALQR